MMVEDNAGFDTKFKHGELKRVGIEDIKAGIILTQARIECAEYIITNEPKVIAQYLAEIKHFEIAIDICLAFKESPAYPIALMLKEYHSIYFKEGDGDYQKNIGDNEEESKAGIDEEGESFVANKRFAEQIQEIQNDVERRNFAKVQAFELFSKILATLSIKDKLEIAKVLSS